MDIIRVVCWIIFFNDKVFICRRNAKKSLAWYWEFPWGKTENNESDKKALKRELYEEIKMEVKVKDYFKSNIHVYDFGKIELVSYLCEYVKSDFELTDHDKYDWVKISELNRYDFAPADIPIVVELSNLFS